MDSTLILLFFSFLLLQSIKKKRKQQKRTKRKKKTATTRCHIYRDLYVSISILFYYVYGTSSFFLFCSFCHKQKKSLPKNTSHKSKSKRQRQRQEQNLYKIVYDSLCPQRHLTSPLLSSLLFLSCSSLPSQLYNAGAAKRPYLSGMEKGDQPTRNKKQDTGE